MLLKFTNNAVLLDHEDQARSGRVLGPAATIQNGPFIGDISQYSTSADQSLEKKGQAIWISGPVVLRLVINCYLAIMKRGVCATASAFSDE